jgi:CRISPR-associated protein Csx10
MGLKLTFEIELRSDYHVSAGHGLGALVDSALHRDADGLPVLRGTTLVGLLRDGLYRLLKLEPLHSHVACQASGKPKEEQYPRFCGQYDLEQKDCPICRLFGSPRLAKRWRVSSARPVGLPHPLDPAAGWLPGQTGGLVAPHVRVNPRTRRAEARKLFFREEGDGRLRFRFAVTRDTEDAQILDEAAWLVAAARFVRNLGAGRRRGRGECIIHLLDEGTTGACLPPLDEGQSYEEWFLSRFEQRMFQGAKLDEHRIDPRPFAPSQAEAQEPVHLLVARLDEPLLISEKAEAGNEFQTMDYIPGSTLRGALAGRAASRYGLDPRENDAYRDSQAYAAFVRLFFRDGVRCSPLYPAHLVGNDLYPSLPAPLDLLSCELYPGFAGGETAQAHGASSFAHSDDLHPSCSRCNSDLKPLGKFSGFLSLRHTPDRVEPARVTEMHVHIDPDTRRAASGDLFGFDTLAPGQFFVGEIACADAAAWEDLCALADLPKEGGYLALPFGKANRRGYGQVTLWIEPRGKGTEHPWRLIPLAQRLTSAQAPLTLTLLTDTILADPWGRFLTGFDSQWLSNVLGVQVTVNRCFCAARVVDGFYAHLGLPRWRDVALRAGSAAGLTLVETLSVDELQRRLAQVERDGIGLRRNEGFGQVVFNHPLYEGCAGVPDQPIRLSKPMCLEASPTDHTLPRETNFRQKWNDDLMRYKWEPLHKPEFEFLARLLRSQMPASVQDVESLWNRLGHSDELLPPQQVQAELAVREREKAKLNFFRAAESKAGRKALLEIVQDLAERATGDERCWRIGLEMLADRVAAEARWGEEGREG